MSDPAHRPGPNQPITADALTRRLTDMAARDGGQGRRGPAPVHLWEPEYCGELDIRIARDGLWHYLGTPIGRPALVRLFASVLRKDADGRHYLVTPVEKIGITVDDAPFVAVDFTVEEPGPAQRLRFVTNVGDEAVLGPEHPLRMRRDPDTGEPTPYILVRGRLEARIDRKSFYRLADIGETEDGPDGPRFGLRSDGAFFALADAEETAQFPQAGATPQERP